MAPQAQRKDEHEGPSIVNINEVKTAIETRVEGNTMIVTVPLSPPVPSSGGKMMIVASTHGFKPTDIVVDGKPLMLNLTAAI